MRCGECNKEIRGMALGVRKNGKAYFFCSKKCKERWKRHVGRTVELFTCGAGI